MIEHIRAHVPDAVVNTRLAHSDQNGVVIHAQIMGGSGPSGSAHASAPVGDASPELAEEVLTQKGEWRKRPKPAPEELQAIPGLREALAALLLMPPEKYTDRQWGALHAILALLKPAAAQLIALFGERGQVDFTQIAHGALRKVKEGRRASEGQQKEMEQLQPQLEKWEAFCAEIGENPADVALAWLLKNPVVTAPIIGPRTIDQLTGGLRALEINLTDEQMKTLDEIWPGPGGPAPEAYAW